MVRLIVGCGYLGIRVADRWVAAGDQVHVITRSTDRATRLAARGFQPLLGDVTDPATFPSLPRVDTALWAVGHDRQSGKLIREVYVDGLRNVSAALSSGTDRVVYISSTGVYGQQNGERVDETSHCEPRRAGGRACLDAEQHLLASTWSDRTVILRLAGIYGLRRLPSLQQLVLGQPLCSDPDGVINLIHVDDAVDAVVRVADLRLALPRIYLIADGHPVGRRAFYRELARQVHAPPPVFDARSTELVEAKRSGGNKRISNRRMLNELSVELQYPSYREGLSAVAQELPK